jgi:glycosyltransferase involved in cell wall biosynthesis
VEEGFGVISIESMACGVPVLAFDRGALTEIVLDNINGIVVPEATVEQLTEKLTQAARHPSPESLGRDGRRMVEETFTWDKIVSDMNRHYQRVMPDSNYEL